MQVNNYRILLIVTAGLLALMLNGCGGGGENNEPEPTPINHPPSVNILQPDRNPYILDVQTEPFLDITIAADDPDGDKLTCTWTWNAGSMSPEEDIADADSQLTSRFTPPNYDGPCTITASVSDGKENPSVNFELQVTGTMQPGTQLRIVNMVMTPDPVAPSKSANITATVENPNGKPLTYTWRSKHGQISGTGSTVVWTTPSTPGTYGIYLIVNDGTDSAGVGKVFTVSGPSGGLLGQYFKTYRHGETVLFDDMMFSRIDPAINFFWEKMSPDPGKLAADNFGVRWTGFVKCESSGSYVFRVHVDDGVRMKILDDTGQWIDVIPNTPENWKNHVAGAWLPTTTIPVQLDGSKWYPIELDYFEDTIDAFIDLYWSVNGNPETVISQECLRPPG